MLQVAGDLSLRPRWQAPINASSLRHVVLSQHSRKFREILNYYLSMLEY